MRTRRMLKLLHVCGTAWFVAAAAYVIVAALRQAGVKWWLIFSMSGYGATLLFLLISAYLYALFRDNGRNHLTAIEHPLTNTNQYMMLYSLMPFLGTAAGLYCIIDTTVFRQIIMTVAMGTLGATFFFWIIFDPAITFAEILLPESRRHRLARHAAARAAREQKQREREQILADIEKEEEILQQRLEEVIGSEVNKLAALTMKAIGGSASAEDEVVQIGLRAWRVGGLECMQKLCTKAAQMCPARDNLGKEFISIWWDGIGQWRHKLLT